MFACQPASQPQAMWCDNFMWLECLMLRFGAYRGADVWPGKVITSPSGVACTNSWPPVKTSSSKNSFDKRFEFNSERFKFMKSKWKFFNLNETHFCEEIHTWKNEIKIRLEKLIFFIFRHFHCGFKFHAITIVIWKLNRSLLLCIFQMKWQSATFVGMLTGVIGLSKRFGYEISIWMLHSFMFLFHVPFAHLKHHLHKANANCIRFHCRSSAFVWPLKRFQKII